MALTKKENAIKVQCYTGTGRCFPIIRDYQTSQHPHKSYGIQSTGQQEQKLGGQNDEAGRTMMVDTKRAPAAGIIKAMATPVTILKAMDMARTGRPSTKAVSSSKVRMYMGLRNKTVKIKITIAITKRG